LVAPELPPERFAMLLDRAEQSEASCRTGTAATPSSG
jgi:hypothetical protein